MFGKSMKEEIKKINKKSDIDRNDDFNHFTQSQNRPYDHARVKNDNKEKSYIPKYDAPYRPKRFGKQFDEVYAEIDNDKKVGCGPNPANLRAGKDFVLSYVGSLKDKSNTEYNKFSRHYDPRKDKSYGGDDRIVDSETFIVKMHRKCKYDPTDKFALDEDRGVMATADYRNKLLEKVAARTVY